MTCGRVNRLGVVGYSGQVIGAVILEVRPGTWWFIPAQGIQPPPKAWIPACAGMTRSDDLNVGADNDWDLFGAKYAKLVTFQLVKCMSQDDLEVA
jgi:hypothetical protein